MKTKLLHYMVVSCTVLGLFATSCTEELPAKASDLISNEEAKEIVPSEEIDFSVDSSDSVVPEVEVIPPPPPPPLPPEPWPEPDPEPWPPYPEPDPDPIPLPVPMPKRVVDEIFEITEVEAEFQGGTEGMMKFIQENIRYPREALEIEAQGRVYVEFVVEKDGSLKKIKILRGVSEPLDREAMRVVRAMPNWKPAENAGQIVRSRMRLPITFRLD